jgi:chromosome segregation ATPase
MKNSLMVMFFSIAIVVLCINAYADNTSQQIAALEQKAELIKNQINQAQSQCGGGVESQLKSMTASIESLVQQRAQLGTHISQLEAQIEELKKNNRASCATTVKQREDELKVVKQEIAGLVAKEKAEAIQKAAEQKVPVATPAAAAPAPAPAPAPALPAAAPGKAG